MNLNVPEGRASLTNETRDSVCIETMDEAKKQREKRAEDDADGVRMIDDDQGMGVSGWATANRAELWRER
jgi:hypothetical protein